MSAANVNWFESSSRVALEAIISNLERSLWSLRETLAMMDAEAAADLPRQQQVPGSEDSSEEVYDVVDFVTATPKHRRLQ